MRVGILLLAGVTGLAAQAAEQDARAKLQQFEQNLQNAMRPQAARISLNLAKAPERACAIPLLTAMPGTNFRSNMPVIKPDPKVTLSAREIIPPAPVCGVRETK